MREDIWRGNILQGVEIIELYLWLKKSAIGWILTFEIDDILFPIQSQIVNGRL